MEPSKQIKKPFAVKPTLYAACVELCKGNTVAGGLLCQFFIFSMGKTLKDENDVIGWLAMTREQWRYVTGFSRHQYDDAIKYLKRNGLIQYRRRKLYGKDRAALSWFRLPDSTKSATAEIMVRPAISAFAELTASDVSANAEETASPISVDAESLIKNEILLNEDISENVIIGEKTISEGLSKKKESKEKKSNKKSTAKDLSKKDWFYVTMKEVYKNCSNFSPEPYQESSAKILEEILEYLNNNPGGMLEACPVDSPAGIYALSRIITNWADFSSFAEGVFNGYKIPKTPQLWSIKHQLKAIPDYVKLKKYLDEIDVLLTAAGISPIANSYSAKDIDKFYEYLELSPEKKKDFLMKAMLSTDVYKNHQSEVQWKEKMQNFKSKKM